MDKEYEQYGDLFQTSHKGYKSVPPEEEFFKSVYIGGQDRKNHINIVEKAGKLHIRGFSYNLDRITMLITHVKNVLVKTRRDEKTQRDAVDCFSYQSEAQNNKGTSGRQCGNNSAERAAMDFCKDCRSNLVVSGIYCDDSGKPFVDDRNELVRIFIRARGMKYTPVRAHLDKLATMDIDPPFFTDEDPKVKSMERVLVNNKRFVTVITIGDAATKSYGIKKVFQMDTGQKVPREVTQAVLTDAKGSVKEFNEKFDWSRNKTAVGYSEDSQTEESDTKIDATQTFESPTEKPAETKQTEPEKSKTESHRNVNFEDIKF